ncbi:MAG TPA: hypothetical protein VFV79_04505 [Saprospiraceae bacterium]|nr:hypothetical protein [Saprospiraceae bacterium]
MSLKDELQSVISGDGKVKHGEVIQTIAGYLRRKKEAISEIEKTKFLKEQEAQILIDFINARGFWYKDIDQTKFIGEGAEQKIYEFSDPQFVIKLNDSIFYQFWVDYFNSLLIHNYFFPHLAYELLGFHFYNEQLCAVVKQPFVRSTENTDLNNVREFLVTNGFINRKANDYFNPTLGIIVEDLHDENVLTEEGTLQFIDTVFFLMPSFYEKD